jgi:hypothetical protein
MNPYWRELMKITLRTTVIGTAAFVYAAFFSLGLNDQGNLSLAVSKADAQARVYIRSGYASRAVYVHGTGLPWNAVRAYYWDGPWSGNGYTYTGWSDYATRNGIACTPGTAITGGDGIMYNCQ